MEKASSWYSPCIASCCPFFSCLSQGRGCLVRREIYGQISGQCSSEEEEQLIVNWEMKKRKKELYGFEECSNANGIKCCSMKVTYCVGREFLLWGGSRSARSGRVEERCGCMNQSQNDSKQPARCGCRKRLIPYLGISERMCLVQNCVLHILCKTLGRRCVYNSGRLCSGKAREEKAI